MAKYNEIRPLAFTLTPDNPLLTHTFQSLAFPANWKNMLKDLKQATSTTALDRDKISIPVRSLNKSLRTLAPDLISVIPNAGTQGANDWLFSSELIDVDALRTIALA